MTHTDICIAGAGVIGLSLAIELQSRGVSVTVLEARQPLREASWAAAGMLAAYDPHNPAELSALAELSVSLYPQFLGRIQDLGGITVPFQTIRTLQSTKAQSTAKNAPPRIETDFLVSESVSTAPPPLAFQFLDEHSIDPRQLAASLLAAAAATSIRLLAESPVISTRSASGTVQIVTRTNTIEAAHFIDCTGAWASDPEYRVSPIKGQMLAVALPPGLPLQIAIRTADIYIVPRTTGPNAGKAIIGATIEDIGFDKTVRASQIEDLRQQAIALLPALANASVIESWSGLRPATQDRLPILGPHPSRPNSWVATGHYRNGILLAPATARVMAQTLLGETPSMSIGAFSPTRPSLRSAFAL